MDELNVDWGTLLKLRDAFQRAAVELTTVPYSEALQDVLDGIRMIDDIMDEPEEEYYEDEYEDPEYETSELRFE